HEPVAALAGLELLEPVGVDPAEELPGVGPADLDLAQRRGVLEADGFAHALAFAQDRGVHVLTRLRVVPGTLPPADILELGAVGDVPGVDRGDAGGVEELSPAATGQGREGHGSERGAEGRVADASQVRAL